MEKHLALVIVKKYIAQMEANARRGGHYYSERSLKGSDEARVTVNGPQMWCLSVGYRFFNIEDHGSYWVVKGNGYRDTQGKIAKDDVSSQA